MTTVEYRVLEYARSETETITQPFAVTLRLTRGDSQHYKSILLREWQNAVLGLILMDIDYVEDVLFDLRQQEYVEELESDSMFESLANLSSGPIRTGLVGACNLSSLPDGQRQLLENDSSELLTCTSAVFGDVVMSLQQSSRNA